MQILGFHIEHREIGSQHLFTSPELHGLYVAHADYDVGFREVEPAIRMLQQMAERRKEKGRLEKLLAAG